MYTVFVQDGVALTPKGKSNLDRFVEPIFENLMNGLRDDLIQLHEQFDTAAQKFGVEPGMVETRDELNEMNENGAPVERLVVSSNPEEPQKSFLVASFEKKEDALAVAEVLKQTPVVQKRNFELGIF